MKKRGFICWVSLQLFVLILIMTVTGGVSQATVQGITPSGIDVSSLKAEIENYIEEHKDTTAAVSVAVFQNGKTIHEGYYGNGNIEMVSNSPKTVMEWGSVTKMLIWVSVMQLVELGEIDLNEDIKTYLPGDFLTKLKYNQPITMMNLALIITSNAWNHCLVSSDFFLSLQKYFYFQKGFSPLYLE